MSVENEGKGFAESKKERHGFTSFWLILGVIVNALTAIFYLGFPKLINDYIGLPGFRSLIAGLCSLGIILGYVFLLKWKKFGFWFLLGISILNVLLYSFFSFMNRNLETGIIGAVIAPVIMWGILQIRKNGKSAWEQLG